MTISLLISLGSLLISLLTYLYVRGTIEVYTIWKRGVCNSIMIDDGTSSPTEISSKDGYENALYRIEIANTSNQNVGLSGFRAIKSDGTQIQILTLDNLYGTYGHQGSAIRFIMDNGSGMLAHLPQNLSNTLLAKQTTVFDIVIFEPVGSNQPLSRFLTFSTIETNLIPWKNRLKTKEKKYDLVLQRGIKKSILQTAKLKFLSRVKNIFSFFKSN
ncbi:MULTISPECIES: hypothetical protein [Leuconostoc gelidum group]|uniref:hypothetical protein n=1 Tax=Leuconostoc gelidum group TaxID=3016637 RepID=UPI00027E6C5E|nr:MULTISPECIES: hypothetical protein [Leuconostoc gelidum group]AFS40257.1 hypothetical protein C269_04070 [Leuconostoc gelidum JB7]MBZ5948034.1 hypothetical protein [Leuconostoc gasicomitatum]MBZ5988174.1 hypothetical protein [Leuconostoc gasicomitatum]MBZ5990158.1 hypothetical protein [Leuconostoc gasicomitatum]